MAGRPLRPATRRRLGRPSPHQQTDRPRAHPQPKNFPPPNMRKMVISGIRPSFPGLSRSQGQVTHVILTRSPLIHPVQAPSFSVRLACVKHAASVRPEPGSNSPLKTKERKDPNQKKTDKNKNNTNNTKKRCQHHPATNQKIPWPETKNLAPRNKQTRY